MDERQAHELLTKAADEVVASAGLSERAERRYQRRRARSQMVATAVVVVLVGSGIATAAVVAGNRSSPRPVSPTPTTRPRVSLTVNTKTFGSLAFVNDATGYGVATTTSGQAVLAKTDDGARTWHALAVMPARTYAVTLAPPAVKLALWGPGGVWATNDDGTHVREILRGDVAGFLSSAQRMWATTRCGRGQRCSEELVASDDGGRTWTRAIPWPAYVDAVAVSPKSAKAAYVVELPVGSSGSPEIAYTANGATWTREPTPCPSSAGSQLAVGGDGVSLMLVCSVSARDRVFVSGNRGRTWTETVALPSKGRVSALSSYDGADSAFVVGLTATVRPGWANGPLTYPTLDQWAYKDRPQPIGDVRAFAFAPGAVMYFAASTGVWYDHDGVRLLRTAGASRANAVDPHEVQTVSFVSARVGFGLATGAETGIFVRTDDGGKTWVQVGSLFGITALHFERAVDGVAWGQNEFEVTIDGGNHWSTPRGAPVNQVLTWAAGRLWAISFCDQNPACAVSRPAFVSDDVGRTWRKTAPVTPGLEDVAIVATSRSTAYVAGTSPRTNRSQLAVTTDGGASWRYEPTPCGTLDSNLAHNDRVLLLVCTQGQTASQEFSVYTSADRGRTWTASGTDPFVGGYFGTLTNVGSTFVAAMQRGEIWSSSDGKTWRRETEVGEGFWSVSTVPGVGAFAADGDDSDNPNSGLWFSADGARWAHRP